MGRQPKIDRLPEAIRQRLIELLQDPAVTQKEVTEIINQEAGEDIVSRSGVNRYAQKMKEFTKQSQQAREVANLYYEKMGENRSGTLGKVINEQVRLITFDLMLQINELKESDMSDPEVTKGLTDIIYKVSRSIKELEIASMKNLEMEKAVRSRIAEEVEDEGKKQGLTEETVELIKKRILGLE